MALPIPSIISDQSVLERTKFAVDGTSFTFLVAEWPTVLASHMPATNTMASAYPRGDSEAITHILYRIIEKNNDDLLDADRDAILSDTTQYADWHDYGSLNIRYIDSVFELVDADRAAGKHVATMPSVVVDATTMCYWVTAWLGIAATDILLGYDDMMP